MSPLLQSAGERTEDEGDSLCYPEQLAGAEVSRTWPKGCPKRVSAFLRSGGGRNPRGGGVSVVQAIDVGGPPVHPLDSRSPPRVSASRKTGMSVVRFEQSTLCPGPS